CFIHPRKIGSRQVTPFGVLRQVTARSGRLWLRLVFLPFIVLLFVCSVACNGVSLARGLDEALVAVVGLLLKAVGPPCIAFGNFRSTIGLNGRILPRFGFS